jgi:hypothetical protein
MDYVNGLMKFGGLLCLFFALLMVIGGSFDLALIFIVIGCFNLALSIL